MSSWSDWLAKAQEAAGTLPENYISGSYKNPDDQASAAMDYILEKSGANTGLSPFVTRYLRSTAMRPFYQRHILAGGESGAVPTLERYGAYLQNWFKSGAENMPQWDVKTRLGQIADRMASGTGAVSDAWKQNPETVTRILQEGMNYGGPFGDYYKNKLGELYGTYKSMGAEAQPDYYDFLRKRLMGLF